MDGAIILSGAVDGAALAFTGGALIFGYRAVTKISDDNFDADMRRQAYSATFAMVAGALAVALLIGQMAF